MCNVVKGNGFIIVSILELDRTELGRRRSLGS